jgi:hypothetical protein
MYMYDVETASSRMDKHSYMCTCMCHEKPMIHVAVAYSKEYIEWHGSAAELVDICIK